MTLECGNCRAPLRNVSSDQIVATCEYCHAVTRIAPAREPRVSSVRPAPAPRPRVAIGLVTAGLVISGAVAAFVAQSRFRPEVATSPAPMRGQPVAPSTPPPLDRRVIVQAEKPPPSPEGQGQDAGVAKPRVAGTAARDRAPARTDPILSKQQAQQVLEPELLSCMKQHGVHYLITRLGNERRGGDVPPLQLTGTSVVDYAPVPGFAKSPLGRCIAKAADAVRAPAYSGNYIYFGLRNDAVPDPLGDAPARLDAAAAKRALVALDDEARECAARFPRDSRPGESLSITVRFSGASGRVTTVAPYYVEPKSAYARCLSSVYGKAQVGRFKKIDEDVLHVLAP